MLQQLTLDKLRDGHEAVRSLNVRQVGRDEGIEALAASIAHHGLLAALVVSPVDPSVEDGVAYVVDGNRRLAALRLLVEREQWPADRPVPVMLPTLPCGIVDGVVTENEISLAANVMRVAMHPADAYVAYAKLSVDGLSAEEIAARFGAPLREVQKALALGRIAPAVLQAWRAGKIDTKAAQAFTLATDDDEQERVLAKALKRGGWQLRADSIRQALGAAKVNVLRDVKFVGVEAYRAAGGAVAEDMFAGEHRVADPKLAAKLAKEKLQVECARLTAPAPDGEGWAWAAVAGDLPDARYSWQSLKSDGKPTTEEKARLKEIETASQKLRALDDENELDDVGNAAWDALGAERELIEQTIRLRGFDEDQRAKAGCILSLSSEGALDIQFGVVRPGTKAKDGAGASTSKTKAKAKKKSKVERGDPFAVSGALAHRLSVQLTEAIAIALPDRPHVGLAALLAAIDASRVLDTDPPLKANVSGRLAREPLGGTKVDDDADDEEKGESFEALFDRYVKQAPGDLILMAAHVASRAVDLVTHNAQHDPFADDGTKALLAAMKPESLRAALRDRFDPEGYFKAVPKGNALAAIAETLGTDQAKALAGKKRGEIEKFATAYVPQTGWLPPSLRVPGVYEGPKLTSAATAAKAPEAAPAKKGQRKRAQAPTPRPRATKLKPKAKAKAKSARKRAAAPKRRAA